jgi:hypothetical protein
MIMIYIWMLQDPNVQSVLIVCCHSYAAEDASSVLRPFAYNRGAQISGWMVGLRGGGLYPHVHDWVHIHDI